MNSTKQELQELIDIKQLTQHPLFTKYIVKPLKDEREKLTTAFFSDSLKESWRKGGRREGINLFFKNLKQIDTDYKNKLFELEQSEKES